VRRVEKDATKQDKAKRKNKETVVEEAPD